MLISLEQIKSNNDPIQAKINTHILRIRCQALSLRDHEKIDITIFTQTLVIVAAKERILMKSKFPDKKSFNCLKRVKNISRVI